MRASRNVDVLLTAEDVARLLSVKVSWVYQEARRGRLPFVQIGRYRRFRRESIDEWAAGLERGPGRPSSNHRSSEESSGAS
jgi:excisionase family DNA binding protein